MSTKLNENKQRGRPKKTKIVTTQKTSHVNAIYQKYIEKCQQESDINLLLPYIYDIVKSIPNCRCVEFGVRIPTSTYAFLAAKPKRLVSYDIGKYPQVDEVEKLCFEEKQDFEFVLANVMEIEIQETDFLFIDTLHTKKQLENELKLHASKVRHFIGIHDWHTYYENGEAPYNDETSPYGGGLGLRYAIEDFLGNNKEWSRYFETNINNGMLILKRNEII